MRRMPEQRKRSLEGFHVAEDIALLLRLEVGKDEVLAPDLFLSEAAFFEDAG